jgi:uncharacterized protein YndB with AHSA1/START domain
MMAAMAHELDVKTPNDFDVVCTRIFDAPIRLVFDCYTKPALVRRWLLGPPGWSMPVCDIDLRVGGRFRYVWRNDENGREFALSGTYREIVAPSRIVHVEAFEGGEMEEALGTTVFVEDGGRTTMTLTISFASRAARDAALATGMTGGMAQSYDRLDALLRSPPA